MNKTIEISIETISVESLETVNGGFWGLKQSGKAEYEVKLGLPETSVAAATSGSIGVRAGSFGEVGMSAGAASGASIGFYAKK